MLITERLYIRFPEESDARLLKLFEEKNKEQLKKVGSGEDVLVGDQWQQQLAKWVDDFNKQKSVRFCIFSKESKSNLIGIVHYTDIIRGYVQSTYLGYYADYECANVGLLQEALQVTIAYMFGHYMLHRIVATYQPKDIIAAQVLKSLGFRVEGYAYDYVFSDGDWQDHILTALINTDWQKRLRDNEIYSSHRD